MLNREILYEVCSERVYLRNKAAAGAAIDTELFFGTPVIMLQARTGEGTEEGAGNWCKVRSTLDGYEGYVEQASLARHASLANEETRASLVIVPLALAYEQAKDTAEALLALPMSSRLRVSGEEGTFTMLRVRTGGDAKETKREVFVKRHQLLDVAECGLANGRDWIATAMKFLHAPYLYGGGCYAGIDCSALLQVAMGVHGMACPRDSAPQERELGEALDWQGEGGTNPLPALERGDLIFWNRHVGVMTDAATMLHANAGSMSVACEPLIQARARIRAVEGEIRCIKRMAL